MTSLRATNQPTDSAPAQPAADPRPGFAAALEQARAVLAVVGAVDLGRPTPCDDYDVESLARHMVSMVGRIGAVARGEDAASVPSVTTAPASDELLAAFDRARAEQEAAWSDKAVLDAILTLPFGSLPGRVALGVYLCEATVHTWDLATALGQPVEWDDQSVEVALAAMQGGLPAEPRGAAAGIPFGPVVPTAPDAPAIDRLVAWTGRDPAWRPGR